MSIDYRAYMASDAWAMRRVAALKRSVTHDRYFSRPRCEVCGRPGIAFKNRVEDSRYRLEGSNGLNVHHLHYRNLGNESPEDLIVLCTDVLYYEDHDRAYEAWRNRMLAMPGDRPEQLRAAGPSPPLPENAGCHERVHNDPAFKREVSRIASQRR
jgi:hypothetical protein